MESLINENFYINIDGLCSGKLHLKIEGLNPAGSIKLKTAYSLIKNLEREGKITSDRRLIESSSGNLGVALAMVCAERGYRFICVVDPNISISNKKLITSLGAELIVVDQKDENGGYLLSRIRVIKKLVATNPAYIWLNQYKNPANPLVHYSTTAKAIAERFSRIDYLFVGAGTTGTLMGCKTYFSECRPEVKVIAVDSIGSVTFGFPGGPRFIPGLGTSRKPEIFDPDGLHALIRIPEKETVRMCRWLARHCGFLCGGSTGTVLAALYKWRDHIQPEDVIVAISPDMGEKYLENIYSDDWVRDHFDDETLYPFIPALSSFKAA